MMHNTFKWLVLALLLHVSLQSQAQRDCQLEVCKAIRLLQELKETNNRNSIELASLRRQVNTLKQQNAALVSENQKLKKKVLDLELELAKVKGDTKTYDDINKRLDAENKRLKEETKRVDTLKNIISNQESSIATLKRDSVMFARKFAEFKEKNIVFDDGYAIPYNVPIGPIEISRSNGYEMAPQEDDLRLLRYLSDLFAPEEINIDVVVNVPRNKENQVKKEIEQQIRNYCSRCKIITKIESGGDWTLFLKFRPLRA